MYIIKKGKNYDVIEEQKSKKGTLVNSFEDKQNVFGYSLVREEVEAIYVRNYVDIPVNALFSWDASIEKNESIWAFVTDDDDNYYELYLNQEGGVIAPASSYYLFGSYSNVLEMDLSGLNTSIVTSMCSMFEDMKNVKSLDLSNFDTSMVVNMKKTFANMHELKELKLNKAVFTSVSNSTGIFNNIPSDVKIWTLNDETKSWIQEKNRFW